MNITKPRLAALAVTAVLSVAACSGGSHSPEDPTPQKGGSLTVGAELGWATDPSRATNYAGMSTVNAIYDQLLYSKPDNKVEPGLAESYEVSRDGKKYTVVLRKGMTFHDGTPVDAEAVKVNIERVKNPKTASTYAIYFAAVDKVNVVDEQTVEILMKSPDVAFLRNGLGGPGSGLISPAALKRYGDKIDQHPVGAGPFKFVSESPGDSIKLARFDDYWDEGRPYLDSVSFKMIQDPQARFSSLLSGAVDVAQGVDPKSEKSVTGNDSVHVSHPHGFGTTFVQLNNSKPPFNDIEARKAVCAATDRDALNKATALGVNDTDIYGPFGPDHPYSPKKAPTDFVEYDVAEAKRLVQEMGGLKVNLTIPAPFRATGEALVGQWEAAGIDVTAEQIDGTTSIERATKRQYEAMPYRYQGDVEPDRNLAAFFTQDGWSNTTGFDDQEVSDLIKQGREATDATDRQGIYGKVSNRLAEETPMCWLWSNDIPQAWTDDVHGIPEDPRGATFLRDAYVTK